MPSVILNLRYILEEGQVTNIAYMVRNAKENKAIWKI
jgi:hypothetical protein